MMELALGHLARASRDIAERCGANEPHEKCEKLLFCGMGEWIHVEFYGLPFDESFEEFLRVLCVSEVAERVGVLVMSGPDEGANGTKNWDLTPLVESSALFPRLRSMSVQQTAPEDHNHSVIASIYEEEGQIARLLAKAPRLESFSVPSAPDASFFEGEPHPLRTLRVEAGYDAQNFVLNLARSHRFVGLKSLDFGDTNQRCTDDSARNCTPFSHFEELFRSEAFSSVTLFLLRNTTLKEQELGALRQLRKDLSFMVIEAPPGKFVSGT